MHFTLNGTSEFRLAVFLAIDNHKWLVATILKSIDLAEERGHGEGCGGQGPAKRGGNRKLSHLNRWHELIIIQIQLGCLLAC